MQISPKKALCYEQTSPLGVPLYAFGSPKAMLWLSLSILHYFSKVPKKSAAKCTDRIKQDNVGVKQFDVKKGAAK